MPWPQARLKDRRTLNFRKRVRNLQPNFPFTEPFLEAYKTPDLDVRGFTFHNVFFSFSVFRVEPADTQVELVVELLESFGSSGASGDRRVVLAQVPIKGGAGISAVPAVPLLGTESQALEIAGVVLIRTDQAARLDFEVRGMLAAGYSIEQRA